MVSIKLNLDWEELRKQKLWLISQSNGDEGDGILGILDEIQDQAAVKLGDEVVFGPEEVMNEVGTD